VGSPLKLTLFDETGRYLDAAYDPSFGAGVAASYIPHIFGSTYAVLDGTQVFTISAPVSSTYHLDMLGIGDGEYTVEAETWLDDQMTGHTVHSGTVTIGEPLGMAITVTQSGETWLADAASPTIVPIIEVTPTALALTGPEAGGQFVVREVGGQEGIHGLRPAMADLVSPPGRVITQGITLEPQQFDLTPYGVQTVTVRISLMDWTAGEYRGSVEIGTGGSGIRRVPVLLDLQERRIYLPLVLRRWP
jgi:hypothetical protein